MIQDGRLRGTGRGTGQDGGACGDSGGQKQEVCVGKELRDLVPGGTKVSGTGSGGYLFKRSGEDGGALCNCTKMLGWGCV